MEELVEKFKMLKSGDRITLTMETLLGGSTEAKATYRENLKQYGYVSKSAGGWALYPCEIYNIPCYKVNIKPYRCSLTRVINLYDVKNVRKGW